MFQPAEEGMGGAEKMMAGWCPENPKVDVALALHVWNEKPVGWIGISSGPAMAGAEIFKIKVLGKGGHGAVPHLAVDPILAAAQIVSALARHRFTKCCTPCRQLLSVSAPSMVARHLT